MTAGDHQNFSRLVKNGEITCITIDTNVIVNNGNSLCDGVVAQLAQFSKKPIQLLISEVVIEEARKYLVGTHETRLMQLRKLVQTASRYLEPCDELEWLGEEIEGLNSAEYIADKEIQRFLIETNAIVIAADYVSVRAVLDLYFAGGAPFKTNGPKKSEFPDAIALMGIESWARETGSGILVVSSDGDWERFCSDSDTKRLFVVKHLSEALNLIQESDEERLEASRARIQQVVKRIAEPDFRQEVQTMLKQTVIDKTTVKGDSYFRLQSEIVRIDDEPFVFLNEPPAFLRNDAKALVLLFDISANFGFWARFSFIDPRTKAPFGSGVYGATRDVTAGLIVTIVDESTTMEIAVASESLIIDYGDVEPDADNELSHLPS